MMVWMDGMDELENMVTLLLFGIWGGGVGSWCNELCGNLMFVDYVLVTMGSGSGSGEGNE